MNEFQQIAAALYLASGVGGLLAVTLPSGRMARGATWGLALGFVFQTAYFATLHQVVDAPSLATLASALALTSWMGIFFSLVFMWKVRLPGLQAIVGLLAFFSVFVSAMATERSAIVEGLPAGGVPHAHVMLASAGIAILGIAGMSGLIFLIEHRRLKSKRPISKAFPRPSLEALDRVNVVALATGLPLLTLGVLTGGAWLMSERGQFWSGSSHETWTVIAWAIYAGLATVRFAGHQGARQAAASALGGFAFLLFAVVGVELLS